MREPTIIDLSVAEIMSSWPSTISIFLERRMHCVGCPISPFHTLFDAAEEHGMSVDDLTGAVEAEIRRVGITAGRAVAHHR